MFDRSTAEKVAFLSCPDSYPGVTKVDVKQTHMSWVFLTDSHAWKMKKPVRNDYMDFSTTEARRSNCEQEVTLNRRLAPDVYLGLVPLAVDNAGFNLAGEGEIVDWLVQMRRVPADRMLDRAIAERTWKEEDLRKIGILLSDFYADMPPAEITSVEYRQSLAEELKNARSELNRCEYRLPANLVDSLVSSGLDLIEKQPALFDRRITAGRIVEGHGDLRPEHICLEPTPVIIDCLEFNRSLRILDVASELMFLRLECERLGAAEVGQRILETYCVRSGDQPSKPILSFYRSQHACVRAKLAVWHLRDDSSGQRYQWVDRAKGYLELAASEL